jgi:cytochrome c peroxidase
MGVGKENLEKKAAEIAAIKGYKEQFEAAFPGEPVSPATIVKTISAYERTLVCNKTAYDKYAKGDESALSDEQKKGLDLFMGKAACVVCHMPPHFSTAYGGAAGTYYNAGVGTQGKAEADVDIGRAKVSGAETDWAAFKVPSLRNVPNSAPYFHDGSAKTLEDAVHVMAGGGIPNKGLSPLFVDRKLSADEVKQLIAFLGALDCNEKIQEPKLP